MADSCVLSRSYDLVTGADLLCDMTLFNQLENLVECLLCGFQ